MEPQFLNELVIFTRFAIFTGLAIFTEFLLDSLLIQFECIHIPRGPCQIKITRFLNSTFKDVYGIVYYGKL